MSNQKDERAENLRELLRQHWNHCRHLESERAWFMNAYAIVVGGAMAFLIGMGVQDITRLPSNPLIQIFIVFLIGLTFFGFFHTIRWTYAFECHRLKVNTLTEIIWGEGKSKARVPLDPTMVIPPMEIKPEFIKGFFRTRIWFSLFYLFILLGLLAICLLLVFSGPETTSPATASLEVSGLKTASLEISGLEIASLEISGLEIASLEVSGPGFPPWIAGLAGAATIGALWLGTCWYLSLKKIEKGKRKVVLEGCNGEWAQKYYLPVLTKKAAQGKIELWAVDITANIKKGNREVAKDWQTAQDLNKAYYLNKDKDILIYDGLSDVDYVFIVTPDRHHCQIAESWLDKLSARGKIFIEKPLDASKDAARRLKRKIAAKENEQVFAFDHYTARALPFLKKNPYPGKINKIELHILESNKIAPEEKNTLKKGVIFDLFCHVLALVYNVVSRSPKVRPPAVERLEVKAARYTDCPILGETFAWIEFRADKIPITSMVGKCVGNKDDKFMRLSGSKGNIELDFANSSSRQKQKPPISNAEAIKSFLDKVLDGKNPLSIDGVLSFDSAFEILVILDRAKGQIKEMPDYPCQETVKKILEKFKK